MTNIKPPASFPRLAETVCPICGKNFIVPPENTYWLYSKRSITKVHFCRYSCYRKAQKQQQVPNEGKRKKIRKTRQLLKRGGIIMTNNNKDVTHGPDKTARQEFGKFDFWVVVPVKATGYYINNWGLPSDGGLPPDTPGIRFKIVAAYNTKEEAVREAEKLIESGGYAFVHDVKEHIDYTYRNNWE